MNRWRAISLAIVVMALAGLAVGFVTNFIVTTVLDGSCSRGLCDAGLFSGYMLLTFWLPFATAAALAFLWLWRSGGRA
jgi:hypothetical protein